MTAKEQRDARLAVQLRANLRRRKAAPHDGQPPQVAPSRDDDQT